MVASKGEPDEIRTGSPRATGSLISEVWPEK